MVVPSRWRSCTCRMGPPMGGWDSSGSADHDAAGIGGDRLAGDGGRRLTGQEQGHLGDLFGRADLAEGHVGYPLLSQLFGGDALLAGDAIEIALEEVGIDAPRDEAVDPDAMGTGLQSRR